MYSLRTIGERFLLSAHGRGCTNQQYYCSCSSNNTDARLFTPGPLNTTHSVKAAMLRDFGSRDSDFLQIVSYVREKLLEVAGVNRDKYIAVPMQGSGTFAVEATIQTAVPRCISSRVLVLSGGAYAERMASMCRYLNIEHDVLTNAPDSMHDLTAIKHRLKNTKYSNVAVVHCDTSSGVVNLVDDIGAIVKEWQPSCSYIVDAMSSIGGMPIPSAHADFIISSANKCLQGVPGCAFVIANKSKLLECKGNSRSLSLDLYDQYKTFEDTGMFRFTPPTHVILALQQALIELEKEGGVEERARRYRANHSTLMEGMKKLGFVTLVPPENSAYIITSFRYPDSPNWSFETFYNKLKSRGQVLYPGKVTKADCFRISNIGDLHAKDIETLLNCIKDVCDEMELKL